jgi:hypothetical protein
MSLRNSKIKSEYWSYLWLAPIFLIRFLRTQTKTKGLIIFVPVYCIAWIIMIYDMYPGVIGNGFGIFYWIVFFPAFSC